MLYILQMLYIAFFLKIYRLDHSTKIGRQTYWKYLQKAANLISYAMHISPSNFKKP